MRGLILRFMQITLLMLLVVMQSMSANCPSLNDSMDGDAAITINWVISDGVLTSSSVTIGQFENYYRVSHTARYRAELNQSFKVESGIGVAGGDCDSNTPGVESINVALIWRDPNFQGGPYPITGTFTGDYWDSTHTFEWITIIQETNGAVAF